MVKEILRIRQTFDYVSKSIVDKKTKDETFQLIETDEWEYLELVAEFLEPFNQVFFSIRRIKSHNLTLIYLRDSRLIW